jgi:hypothetical protein
VLRAAARHTGPTRDAHISHTSRREAVLHKRAARTVRARIGDTQHMRRSGLIGLLLLGAVAVVAGLVGYQAGAASSAAAAGATIVVTGGFPGLGFLFFLLFIGFLFFAFAGMRRRGPWGPGAMAHGHGSWGPGGRGRWGGPDGPDMPGGPDDAADPRHRWVAEMHRQLHAEDAAVGSTPSPATPAATAGESPAR